MADNNVEVIEEILDCAKRWIADDERSGAEIPPHWRRVIPLIAAAPDLFDAVAKMVEVLERTVVDARSIISRMAHASEDTGKVEGGETP